MRSRIKGEACRRGPERPTRKKAKDEWDEINEKIAAEVLNARYRANRTVYLPYAADVEMAVFGLSFEVWPVNANIRDSVRQTFGSTLRGKLHALDNRYKHERERFTTPLPKEVNQRTQQRNAMSST